jgi:methionine synthase II (cobalamin-independent)
VWILIYALAVPSLLLLARGDATARRDPLTDKEADLVREAQALDKRTEVFIKAAERRLLVITDPNSGASSQAQKDAEKWGDFKGTRAELLYDIANILEEAITNIEDAGTHNSKSQLIPKSIRKLAEAATRFLPALTALRDRANDEERGSLEKAIENAQEIVTAANRLPAETKETEQKKKKGEN